MLFFWWNKNKTIEQLRKKKLLTTKALANQAKVSSSLVSKVDQKKLKEIPDPLKSSLIRALQKS